MKVLLLEDVYKLGRAGDVKRVAPGYARNYLMPQGMAVLATPGAVKQAGRIQKQGSIKRAKVNQELGGVAEQLAGKRFTFAAKASETRRLYGSINAQMIAEAVSEEIGVTVGAKQIESQPIRMIGKHDVSVRLTVDLIPEIEIVVFREGETPEAALEEVEKELIKAEEGWVDTVDEMESELDSEIEETSAEVDQTEETELSEEVEVTEDDAAELPEEVDAEVEEDEAA